jgi:mRNA interferase HigB
LAGSFSCHRRGTHGTAQRRNKRIGVLLSSLGNCFDDVALPGLGFGHHQLGCHRRRQPLAQQLVEQLLGKGLLLCVGRFAAAKPGLQAWYEEALRVDWRSPADIKRTHAGASILSDNRVVFNIHGNAYRLVVKIQYDRGFVYVRFVVPHAEYDRIDAATV